jgi:hypothetical protein
MESLKYAKLVVLQTFRRGWLITDRASLLIALLVSAAFWIKGERTPDNLDGLIATLVLSVLGGALLLRFLATPYLIWQDDQHRISQLESEIHSESRRQHEVYQKSLDAERIELVKILSSAKGRAGSGFSTPLPNAALFRADPDFAEALEALTKEANTDSIFSGQREINLIYADWRASRHGSEVEQGALCTRCRRSDCNLDRSQGGGDRETSA